MLKMGRVKMRINDYILNNYAKLFFNGQSTNVEGAQDSKDDEYLTVSQETILSNQELLAKVASDLRLSEDQEKSPRDLLKECINELEQKGFLNSMEGAADEFVYQVRDQRKKLRHFISEEIKGKDNAGMTFDAIYIRVTRAFRNFYTKEFVFKIIDELHQLGLIIETSKCNYLFIDSHIS